MKHTVTTGIILSRTNYGEADRILTVLTPDHGKVRLMAKGVRKVKSKLAGGIELFSVSHISYIQGKSDIYTLTSTRLQKHFGNIVKDANRTMLGYQILKLINKSTEDNAGPEYFELLKQTLQSLDDVSLNKELIEFWLSAQLLKLTGRAPQLNRDINGNKLLLNQTYGFDFNKMIFMPEAEGKYNANHIKILRLAMNIDSPTPLKQVSDINTVLAQCHQLIENIHKLTNR